MSNACTLMIRTSTLRVHLEGDPDFVRAAYAGLRRELLFRLVEESRGLLGRGAGQALPSSAPVEADTRRQTGPDFVWVYRCTDLYNKVHVVERRVLAGGDLGRFVDISQLKRVFVESGSPGLFEGLVPVGKTLWSELTALGRQRLRKS